MTWIYVENPDFKGMTPRILEATCHDGSPLLTVRCSFCKELSHLHESQLDVPDFITEVAMRCPSCGLQNIAPIEHFRECFSKMREEGWIK
jgi:hypothetical protein